MSNFNTNTISRFAGTGPGAFSTTAVTLSGGTLSVPEGLAFDARGDLFAANVGSNSITEFTFNSAAGAFGPGVTVETGLDRPTGLAFGPSVPPAVPEASATASLGLLLALGMGGMVAAKRKKAGVKAGADV